MTATDSLPTYAQPAPAPPREPSRVVGIDIARGLAMLGMITVHVTVGINEPPGEVGQWLLSMPSGRASVLFFTLAGTALSLVARRNRSSAATSALLKRGALLLVGGWFLMSSFWGGSILHQYGAMFLLAPILLRRRSRTLALLAAVCFLAGPLLTAVGPWALGSWATGRYGVHGWALSMFNTSMFTLYALVVWAGFFMVGMILGRLQLTRRQAVLMLVGGAVTCVALTFPVDAINRNIGASVVGSSAEAGIAEPKPIDAAQVDSCETYWLWDSQWYGAEGMWSGPTDPAEMPSFDPSECFAGGEGFDRGPLADAVSWSTWTALYPHANSTAWALQSLSIAIAVLGLCLLLPRIVRRVLHPVAALGTVSLTAYLFHTLLVQDVWTLVGSADDDAGLWPQFWTLVGIWTVELAVATFICWRWRRGPMEWLLAQFSRPTSDPRLTKP